EGAAGVAVHGPDPRAALATLGVALQPAKGGADGDRRRAAAVAGACAALIRGPALLRLDGLPDPLAAALVAAAVAGAAAPSVVLLETQPDDPLLAALGDGALRVGVAPLDEGEMVALVRSLRDDLDRDFACAVHRAAAGLPSLAVELVRAAVAGRAAPTAADVTALDGAGLAMLVAKRLAALPTNARAAVEALAVLGGTAEAGEVAKVAELTPEGALAALADARAVGVVALGSREGHLGALRITLPTAAHRAAIEQAISAEGRQALHRRALALVPEGEEGIEARARHLAVVGPRARAAEALQGAGDAARARGDLAAAAADYRAAVARRAGPGARLRLAEIAIATGDYREARSVLAGVRGGAATLLSARALQRAGDDVAAEACLRRALDAPGAPDLAGGAALRGLLGRVLLARGSAEAALAATRGDLPDGTAAAPALEAAGLARLYLGRLDEAARDFAEAEARARGAGDAALLARARSLSGMVAQQRGDLIAAAAAYDDALLAAGEAGDVHGAATYAQNLGTVLREQADYARALTATESAARDLGRLGKRAERAGALFNLGNLLASVGDLEGAEQARLEAERLARESGATRLLASARSLAGDLARRRGDAASALAAYQAAEEIAAASADRVAVAWARLSRAELLVEMGRAIEAAPLLAGPMGEPGGDGPLADARELTRLRLALAAPGAPDGTAVARVDDVAIRARGSARRDLAFRAEVTLARAHARLDDAPRARAAIARARTLWEEIRMSAPEIYRDRLDDDPDARRLRALVLAVEPAGPRGGDQRRPVSVGDETRLRRLVAVNKRLAAELRLGPLLELIIDAVIELTGAERGFVLLRKPGTEASEAATWEVKVARNIDQRTIDAGAASSDAVSTDGDERPGAVAKEPPAARRAGREAEGRRRVPAPATLPGRTARFSLSRSIAERAAREGVPVITLDAADDQRFEAARSVSDFKLRSVLAAPLIARGEVVGCLYVDHRLRAGAFDEQDVALVLEFADQAAIAVENARLIAENQRRGREVADLAARLEKEVASQRVELGELHLELRESREALKVRYDYRNLVGRTPRMIELFRLLDRVTDTALPVVVHGESGTGKELVARAIHHNGLRAGRPFVSENCAAIPETLLEAALFGHARGAFTGAEGERRGLFEIADGGTLFLDEVGEMSPAMQSKLLRVLQDGEFRRVGGERGRKVDVRIITASNRDLGRLVTEGRFREDLFYRLNVVRVTLPPLRERRDDIPLLVEHFLAKHAAQAGAHPKRIARSALGKLLGYRWPGNVRELENEVLRAAALGGETITVEDLSPQVASGDAEALISPDDLGLHERVERLERSLLREALAKAEGNQSQAARLLGLSRFGLQKKLRRYGIAP
ncbi:MAG: GAF domain-containing protein, partial [Myxococcales bacterium]|nr:GAF domain-containing protein [Myxococcales bacterium]